MHIKNFDPYDFNKTEIEGVPVYWKNIPSAPCIHARIVFNVGGFDDPVGKEGLSHFLEHMYMHGSALFPGKDAYKKLTREYTLNTLNASTYWDFTSYWFKCFPESFDLIIPKLFDMVFKSLLREEDIENERKVIIQEAWNKYSNEKFLNYSKQYIQNIYSGHPLSRSYCQAGWPETISKISKEDLINWREKNYGKGNLFIVLCGAVEESHLKNLEESLKNIPVVKPPQKAIGKFNKPKNNRFIKLAEDIGNQSEQVEITISRFSAPVDLSKAQAVFSLTNLMYDLLDDRLRTKYSLCYSVDVDTNLLKTCSTTDMSVKTEEKNIELVEKEFWNLISEIQEGTHRERFSEIKKLNTEQIRANERPTYNITQNALFDIIKYNRPITLAETIGDAEKVTYEDVAKMAKEIFDPEYVFTEIILPSKKS